MGNIVCIPRIGMGTEFPLLITVSEVTMSLVEMRRVSLKLISVNLTIVWVSLDFDYSD